MNVASNGQDGWPHVTALWYVMRGTDPWVWTYRKSQKVKNLERDDRATALVESGHRVRGAEGRDAEDARAHRARHRDGSSISPRSCSPKYQGAEPGTEGMRDALRAQAAKRVAIRFEVVETVSWDHSKLGGVY